MLLRKALISKRQRDRALFIAPIAVAFGLLFLVTQNKAVLAAALRNPLSVLSDRSPGKRRDGALYNIKPERVLANERTRHLLDKFPQERVLAASRVRPLTDLPPDVAPDNLFPAGDPAIDDFMPLDLKLPKVGLGPTARSLPSLGGVAPGSVSEQSVPTDPENPTEPQNPTPDPQSAVPEPTTWMMQIAGLFLIGGLMRARNRKNRAARSAALPLQG